MLYGRTDELAAIDALVTAARDGRSGVLVLRGDPGIGKTALLEQAIWTAQGMRVLRGQGVEFETELPYAGLHMLLRDALGGLPALPDPQRNALEAAFGMSARPAPEPMLVGLAVLSLLSEYAGEAPVLAVVDDAHWWDRDSTHALLFAVRRLHAEGVALLLATRDEATAEGFEHLVVPALSARAASRLLDEQHADLSATVRYRVLAQALGNPLALRELPLSLTVGEPEAVPLTDRLRRAFGGTVSRLPAVTRTVLLLAALDHGGSPDVIDRAAMALGARLTDLDPAERAGLIHVPRGQRAFRHPLIRNAIHTHATHAERVAAHRALADALDSPEHADRRAWHLAQATTGTDQDVAQSLEDTADRARRRGGQVAACTAYAEAARLSTTDSGRLLVLAAEAATEAGLTDRARELADRVTDPVPELRDRLAYLGILHSFWSGDYASAYRLTLDAAAGADGDVRTELLLQAVHAAWYLGEDAMVTTARLLADGSPRAVVARFVIDAITGTAPHLATALAAIAGADVSVGDRLILGGIGVSIGQDDDAYAHLTALEAEIRGVGGWGRLPTPLFFIAEVSTFQGRYADAAETAREGLRLARENDQRQWTSQFSAVLAYLAALSGDEDECRRYAADALVDVAGGAVSPGTPWAWAAYARLDLGAGRVAEALAWLERLAASPTAHHMWTLRAVPDMVEAATRLGEPERATVALARFAGWAEHVNRPWALALVARCHALLADSEMHFEAAMEWHARERQEGEAARTALLYGEWLRRARRKTEARERLRYALEVFERLGMRPWADRARVELEATGQHAGARAAGALDVLTPQESRIVHLAAEGMSNKDIAARLFLSPRTIGYHLYKAYPKLGVLSRGELAGVVG